MLDRGNFLLAHEMGLGKTICSIAAAEELIDQGLAESVLVICPASIKWQWERQIKKFTDGALVKVIEGTKSDRKMQYRRVKQGAFEYVIMNYEQIVADWDGILRHLEWDVVIGDEIVAIKNPGAKRTRYVRRILAPYKFGLTGQPIENKPEELFSIMEWIDGAVLGRPELFEKMFVVRNAFGGVKHYKNLHKLRERMEGVIHRRTRADVADEMPAVVEEKWVIDFDPKQAALYRRINNELIDVIRTAARYGNFSLDDHYAGKEDKGMNGDVMPRIMAMRMLCNHPRLLTYSADLFDDPTVKAGSAYASGLRQSGALDRLNLNTSPKMTATLELINQILDENPQNKVVLFSFFKPMLALFSEQLKVGHELFTGDLSPKERNDAQERFTRDRRCRVLLSSDAGGIGVDLPVANYLISYDLPWSAGKFAQRQGRIIRLSSKWPEVTLCSMVMRDSIEEWMLDLLDQKGAIAAAWLDGEGVDKQGAFQLTVGGLADFLEDH